VKVRIYLETGGLEHIALGRRHSMWSGNFTIVLEEPDGSFQEDHCEGKWFAGEFEVKLPSRDTAVMWAEKGIRRDQAEMNRLYDERVAKLLALTWEAPE
jgi:hypothetical protein